MFQQDYLLRQIRALTEALARLTTGRRADLAQVEAVTQGAIGLNLDVAVQLSAERLIALLTTGEGLDASRCLILGLALGLRSRVEGADGDALAERAAVLIEAALVARPALAEADVLEVLRVLREPEDPR